MKKYWMIVKNTWNEALVYRLNFVLWRVRMVLGFFITYFLWTTVYSGGKNLFGYTESQIITYVFFIYLVGNFVFATKTQDIGSEINEGKLTNFLLRPVSYFKVLAARDVSDKLLNFSFTIVEVILLFLLFKPSFYIPSDPFIWVAVVVAFIGAIAVYFLFSILLGFVGFWTTEVWATRFMFYIVFEYFSGFYFPIDILPKAITTILYLTPFPYMYYLPVKIFLNQLPMIEMVKSLGVMYLWVIILYYAVVYVWNRGLRVYSAEGR